MIKRVLIRQLVKNAVGGGWGYDAPRPGTDQVAVIRGADFPFIAVGDIARLPIRWEARKKLSSRLLEPGDIVLEISGGTTDRPTGRTIYVTERLLAKIGLPTIPASFCRLVRIDSNRADPRYVYWWLQGMYASGRTWSYQNRSTGIANFQFEHFLDTEKVQLPPLEVQRGIAATLGALDDKIESNRRVIELIEDLVRAHFDKLFDVGLDHDGVSLSSLVVVNPQRRLRYGDPTTYVGMSSLSEFSAEIYQWDTKPAGSGSRFANGDVLMARITPCLENGKTAIVDMLKPDEVGWGSTEYIVLGPRGDIKTPWIYCLARHDEVRSFAIRSMTGSSGRQRFKADRFDEYKITPPDVAAIEEFNAIAEPLFSRMTQLRDEGLRAMALRDTLLPELLSGRIRVPEARAAVQEAVG
jgi:type I restriction enzyme S subunit